MEPVLIIPIVALLIPIVIVPTALGFRHARFLREVEHRERMRAMELGRTLPEDEDSSPGSIALAIGVGVPLGSLALAWQATRSLGGDFAGLIWQSASLLGLCGVICGTILAARHLSARPRPTPTNGYVQKEEYDPDAYDVVGRRG